MVIDQDVVKITDGTAFTTSNNILHKINIKQDKQNDDLIVIDVDSSGESSDDSVEVINQYKLDDTRPIIGKYGKYCKV